MKQDRSSTALEHFKNGRYERSRDICEQILKANPSDIGAIHLIGKNEIQMGRLEKGITFLQKVAESSPNNVPLTLEIGNVFRLCKKYDSAILFLRRALALGAQKYTCYYELGLTYKALNDLNEAAFCFSNALAVNHSCWTSARNLSKIYLSNGLPERAKQTIHDYLQVQPSNPHPYAELAIIHLSLADPEAALKACEDALKLEPAYTRGFAIKYAALSELGDQKGASYLYDYEKLVQRIHGKCPTSFGDIGEFNKYLSSHILNHPSLAKNEGEYAGSINGYHTGYDVLFKHNKKLGKLVEGMILDAVDEYISRLSKIERTHPIHTTRPSGIRIRPWAVVTEFNGYATPHIHPTSWIGGAYYVQLPEDFERQSTVDAGWIEFGRGESQLHNLREPITARYKPVEGDFIIFPGFFWHNTIPLESKQKRICMAFDVEPINGWGK